MAVVIRDGEPVEVPTAEVQVGDLLLIRPGSKIPVDARKSSRGSPRSTNPPSPASLPAQGARRPAGRRDDQQERHPARPRHSGRIDTALAQIVKLVREAQNSKAQVSGSPTVPPSGSF